MNFSLVYKLWIFCIYHLYEFQFVSSTQPSNCGRPGLPDGAWITFSHLDTNSNEQRNFFEHNTTAIYHCKEIDALIGSERRTCLNGSWSDLVPTCAKTYSNQQLVLQSLTVRNPINGTYHFRVNINEQTDYRTAFYIPRTLRPQHCFRWNLLFPQEVIFRLNRVKPINFFKIFIFVEPHFGSHFDVKRDLNITATIGNTSTCQLHKPKILSFTSLVELHFLCDRALVRQPRKIARTDILLNVDIRKNRTFEIAFCELRLYYINTSSCGQPDMPLNSILAMTGPFALFSCNDGYQMIGANRLECQNGQWTERLPECTEIRKCLLLLSHHISVQSMTSGVALSNDSSVNEGELLSAICPSDFLIKGDKHFQCLDGQWSPAIPECSPLIACDLTVIYDVSQGADISVIEEKMQLHANTSLVKPGSQIAYRCSSDDAITSLNRTLTCNLDGEWTGQWPEHCVNKAFCHLSFAQDPLVIERLLHPKIGGLSLENEKVPDGTIIIFACNGSEFSLEGSSVFQCENGRLLDSNKLTDRPPVCNININEKQQLTELPPTTRSRTITFSPIIMLGVPLTLAISGIIIIVITIVIRRWRYNQAFQGSAFESTNDIQFERRSNHSGPYASIQTFCDYEQPDCDHTDMNNATELCSLKLLDNSLPNSHLSSVGNSQNFSEEEIIANLQVNPIYEPG